ncbi:glycosyltransferase [Candidatus Planktophila versatilis]|uniref:Glycosyltransferase n=1 Tax=Candidatus Planktophila versatilis TaxID=1884905 RepID=A0ABN5BAN1_9ACTN|nr:glycosyltransferase [Candidatus Planktophila versatilis]
MVQLSTGHTGGAGLAARRLHAELLQEGYDSEFYCIGRNDLTLELKEYPINRNIVSKVGSRIAIALNERFTRDIHFSVFSTNAVPLEFFKKLSKGKTRVLHFHNWQNLISTKNFVQLIQEGFPIVLTMHDERLITGGCHYRLNCIENEGGCRACPRASKLITRQIQRGRDLLGNLDLTKFPNLHLVSPSLWLQGAALMNLSISERQVSRIPNPLGPDWNTERYLLERTGEIAKNPRIGIATMSDSYTKYGDLVTKLLSDERFKRNYKVLFLRDFKPVGKSLPNFWKEIDLLLALSRADNSPNSIVEAQSLGIPVLTSNVGGILEILDSNGIALEPHEHNIENILGGIRQIFNSQRANLFDTGTAATFSTHSITNVYSSVLDNLQ